MIVERWTLGRSVPTYHDRGGYKAMSEPKEEMVKVGVPVCYGCGKRFKSEAERDGHPCYDSKESGSDER